MRIQQETLETIQLLERLATGNTLMLSEKKARNVWNSLGRQGAKRISLTEAFKICCLVIANYSEIRWLTSLVSKEYNIPLKLPDL